jgi:hypothetical protein
MVDLKPVTIAAVLKKDSEGRKDMKKYFCEEEVGYFTTYTVFMACNPWGRCSA